MSHLLTCAGNNGTFHYSDLRIKKPLFIHFPKGFEKEVRVVFINHTGKYILFFNIFNLNDLVVSQIPSHFKSTLKFVQKH